MRNTLSCRALLLSWALWSGLAPASAAPGPALNEPELAAVSARGLTQDGLLALVRQAREGADPSALLVLLAPLLSWLEADLSVRGVVFDPARSSATVHDDGSVSLRLPSSVGELTLARLRVAGDGDGARFGDVVLRGIAFGSTSVTLRPTP
jgi:hypothetical protein